MDLAERMRNWRVPGVSIAVINEGWIEGARGYGSCAKNDSTLSFVPNGDAPAAEISFFDFGRARAGKRVR